MEAGGGNFNCDWGRSVEHKGDTDKKGGGKIFSFLTGGETGQIRGDQPEAMPYQKECLD